MNQQSPRTSISFKLNGKTVEANVQPFESLANLLRKDLGLTGTKVGCDAGDCGACTILVDGAQVCSCLMSSAQADGTKIETVENKTNPTLDKLRDAFLEHGAGQCGICTPGMLMAATDLLTRNKTPNRHEITDALGGVLCRCTGYEPIIDAVAAAASGASELSSENPDAGNAVGARVRRTDGLAKVSGTEIFADDVAPENCLWLRAIRSPHPRAAFEIIDADGFAKSNPGIEAVLTAADIPGGNGYGIFPHLRHQPVFAERQVRHRGEPVCAIVGDRDAVEHADISALVRWHEETPALGIDGGLDSTKPPLHESWPDNVLIRGYVEKCDVNGSGNTAATSEGNFETAFVEHAYIEPEAGYAAPEGNGRIAVTASTQAPYMDRDEVAHVLGVDANQVRIIPSACGGGFGGKLDVLVQPMLAVAAMKLNRPVRTLLSRIESMAASTKRHPSKIWAKASADKSGRLLNFESDANFDTGAYASWGPTVAGRVPVHATGPYFVPNVRNKSAAIFTNANPSGAFRGFGVPQAAIANETLMDDLAEQLGIDRLEIRHLNAIRAGQETATGQVLEHSAGLDQCLDALRDDWRAMLADAEAFNKSGSRIRRGAGIGCMWYGCGNTSLSNPSTMRVTIDAEGVVTLYNGAVDIGQGSYTIMRQICADAVSIPVEQIEQVTGDTDLTADAGKTSASRQTFVSGKAAQLAGEDLRRNILALANAGENAKIAIEAGVIRVIEDNVRRVIELESLPTSSDGVVLEGTGTYDPPTTPLDDKGQGNPYATYGFAAQICLADVHLDFGTVTLRRFVAAHDLGRAINPTLVEGQIKGGIAQGIGMALTEEFIPGRTENLHDYLIPTCGDIPPIEIKIIEDPEHHGPYGAKGIGEPALVPTPPAIFGAIRHATGVVVRQAPALPHRIWKLLQDRNSP
jgi:CO/xanthine dehydrogenase Mo-binding subunit/aerobic-type carbon monoxide dehydrogenase small subunit (CoxS/CutS family)